MIAEALAAGLVISACLAIYLDEAVYAVAALAGTFFFTSLLYGLDGAFFVAVFQFAIGVGTLAVLFLSGEMLSEKSAKKIPLKNTLLIVVGGAALSLPAILLSISSPNTVQSAASFGEALWDFRAMDVVLQGLVMLTVALGIAIIIYENKKRNGRGGK